MKRHELPNCASFLVKHSHNQKTVRMRCPKLLAALALLGAVSGHGLVSRWTDINTSISVPGWDFWKKPKTAAWYCENGDNGFVSHKDVNTPEIICHRKSAPGVEYFPVKDGDRVQMDW